MLHMPGVLPCITFGIVSTGTFHVGNLTRVEGRFPTPVSIAGTHELRFSIEQVLIKIGTFGKISGIFLFAHTLGHIGCGIIVIYRFQCGGY